MQPRIQRTRNSQWKGNGFGYDAATYGVFVNGRQVASIECRNLGDWAIWQTDPNGKRDIFVKSFYKDYATGKTAFQRAREYALSYYGSEG